MACNAFSLSFLHSACADTKQQHLYRGFRPKLGAAPPLIRPLIIEAKSKTRTENRTARHSRIRKKDVARKVGGAIARSCLEKGITKVAFDRAISLPTQISFRKKGCLIIKNATQNERVRVENVTMEIEGNIYDTEATEEMDLDEKEFMGGRGFIGRNEEEKDYDRDPEFADILGSSLDDPNKARSKVEERFIKKKNKILHTKTGSATPMKVKFNKFDFSSSYIWFEFYNVLLEKDISLICDTIRSWHIVGRLGGCNSMNMQLSQNRLDKRPSYNAIQGANITPTTFYNIGDLEVQDNLARIWVDIGTTEPLILDTLINALTQISSDYVGIKQVVFGGSEFENWQENLTSEYAGHSILKV